MQITPSAHSEQPPGQPISRGRAWVSMVLFKVEAWLNGKFSAESQATMLSTRILSGSMHVATLNFFNAKIVKEVAKTLNNTNDGKNFLETAKKATTEATQRLLDEGKFVGSLADDIQSAVERQSTRATILPIVTQIVDAANSAGLVNDIDKMQAAIHRLERIRDSFARNASVALCQAVDAYASIQQGATTLRTDLVNTPENARILSAVDRIVTAADTAFTSNQTTEINEIARRFNVIYQSCQPNTNSTMQNAAQNIVNEVLPPSSDTVYEPIQIVHNLAATIGSTLTERVANERVLLAVNRIVQAANMALVNNQIGTINVLANYLRCIHDSIQHNATHDSLTGAFEIIRKMVPPRNANEFINDFIRSISIEVDNPITPTGDLIPEKINHLMATLRQSRVETTQIQSILDNEIAVAREKFGIEYGYIISMISDAARSSGLLPAS